jgi:hypothetical protein
VGSSIDKTGKATGVIGSAIVSPIVISGIPEIATISPALTSSH